MPPHLLFGENKLEEINEFISLYGKRFLVVCSKSRRYIRNLQKILNENKVETIVFDKIEPNPSVASCDEGAQIARKEKVDGVIGLGGGSSIDAAKAIAVGATHDGSVWDYLFYKTPPTQKTLPIIAITTTSGTGSHMTPYAVISNRNTKEKSAIASSFCIPKIGICDPRLMLTIPKKVTIFTAFDAFAHSFESYTNINSNPMADLVAFESIKLIFENIDKLLEDLNNLELRTKLALADTYAGIAICNSGTTLPHAMGQPISGLNPNVPHGQSLMMIYPAFLRLNAEFMPEKFIKVAKLLKPEIRSAKEAIDVLTEWVLHLKMPMKLSDVGLGRDDIKELIRQCLVFPDWKFGPRKLSKEEMQQIYEDIL